MFLNSKLWSVFLIIIFIDGCEKKTELTAQMQTDDFIKEKFVEYESVEEEKTQENHVYYAPIEETKVKLTVRRSPAREDSIEYVDCNITELAFYKCSLIEVEGLGQLKFLDTIIFDKCSDLRNFSFLMEVPQLKRIFIDTNTGLNIDWDFINQLPNLEVLYVDFCRQPSISIDLKNNGHLEYIGFTSGVLEIFPTLLNVPNSLKYLNLEGNNIRLLPSNFEIFSHATVFLGMNPFIKDATTPNNLTTSFFSGVLDQKYRLPTDIPLNSIPRISDLSYIN